MNILEKKEEPLLARMMVVGELDFEKATPSYTDVSKELAGQLKSDEKLIVIRHIYTQYGNRKAKVVAYVYNDETKKQFFEPKVKEKKDAKAAPKK